MDGHGLIDRWQKDNRAYHFEGTSGLEKLNELFGVVGYHDEGFRYGDPVMQFLADCPGACEALVEWFADQLDKNQEWKAAFEEHLGPEEDDEESEGDEDDNEEDEEEGEEP